MRPTRPDEGGPAAGPSAPPPRVRVTRTPRRAPLAPARSRRAEVEASSPLGTTYVRSLIHAQGRLARQLVLGLAAALLALPLVFLLVPASRTAAPFGIPLPWLLLGVLGYPVIVGAAVWVTRAAERLERQFTDVVDPP